MKHAPAYQPQPIDKPRLSISHAYRGLPVNKQVCFEIHANGPHPEEGGGKVDPDGKQKSNPTSPINQSCLVDDDVKDLIGGEEG